MYFDTHAHYDHRAFDADRDALLAALPARGVSHIVCPGCDLASSAACIKLAETHPHVYAAVGVHPEEAAALHPRWEAPLRDLLAHPRVVAVGEIGLDYYWPGVPHAVQMAVFRRQLELAQELNLPVIVHDREAHGDCLSIIQEYPAVTGVFHCYSGSVEMAKTLVRLGWMLSFTGNITFPRAKKAPAVLSEIPLSHIMLETDAPYMAPVPHRGRRCDSSYLPCMAETVAQCQGVSCEEVARVTTENALKFFRIPGPAL